MYMSKYAHKYVHFFKKYANGPFAYLYINMHKNARIYMYKYAIGAISYLCSYMHIYGWTWRIFLKHFYAHICKNMQLGQFHIYAHICIFMGEHDAHFYAHIWKNMQLEQLHIYAHICIFMGGVTHIFETFLCTYLKKKICNWSYCIFAHKYVHIFILMHNYTEYKHWLQKCKFGKFSHNERSIFSRARSFLLVCMHKNAHIFLKLCLFLQCIIWAIQDYDNMKVLTQKDGFFVHQQNAQFNDWFYRIFFLKMSQKHCLNERNHRSLRTPDVKHFVNHLVEGNVPVFPIEFPKPVMQVLGDLVFRDWSMKPYISQGM